MKRKTKNMLKVILLILEAAVTITTTLINSEK